MMPPEFCKPAPAKRLAWVILPFQKKITALYQEGASNKTGLPLAQCFIEED
jgi:hypothetical protein